MLGDPVTGELEIEIVEPHAPCRQSGEIATGRTRESNTLKGISKQAAIKNLATKSPMAKVIHGVPVPAKANEKNNDVSIVEAIAEEPSGACHQGRLRSRSKIKTSLSCAIRKALPDAIAIRGVANQMDKMTANANPT